MRVLFFPLYIATPHFETELELMLLHRLKHDEVYVVRCNHKREMCFNNPYRRKSTCTICQSIFDEGMKQVQLPSKNIIKLPDISVPMDKIPKYFSNIPELISYTFEGVEVGRATAGSMIFGYEGEHKLNTIQHSQEIYQLLEVSIYIYLAMQEIISQYKPDRAYVFNGRFAEAVAFIGVCRKFGVEFYTHERAGSFGKYFLRKNALPHEIQPNLEEIKSLWRNAKEGREKIGEQWFLERRSGIIQSWYSFVGTQTKGLLPENFDKYKYKIGIFNSTIEETYTLRGWENPLYRDDNEGILKIAESLLPHPDFQIFVRVHPNLKGKNNSQMRELKEIGDKYPNVIIIYPESRIHSYTLMDHCNLIVTFGSSIGIEASFWGKPSILAARAIYEDLGSVYKPQSHNELIHFLLGNPLPKEKTGALMYGYWLSIMGNSFKFFRQTEVSEGLFLGRKITYNKIGWLKYAGRKIIEIIDWTSLRAFIRKAIKRLIRLADRFKERLKL